MAFTHPVEADRVDDLGFFSTFVRAPVVGTLMWIIGGSDAIKAEEEFWKSVPQPPPLVGDPVVTRQRRTKTQREGTNRDLNDAISHMVGSEFGSVGDGVEIEVSVSAIAAMHPTVPDNERDDVHRLPARLRRCSWSDESGGNLVEYMNEVSELQLNRFDDGTDPGHARHIFARFLHEVDDAAPPAMRCVGFGISFLWVATKAFLCLHHGGVGNRTLTTKESRLIRCNHVIDHLDSK